MSIELDSRTPDGPLGLEAKAICLGCVVWSECLEFAIGTRRVDGIWGGMTERERRHAERTSWRYGATDSGGAAPLLEAEIDMRAHGGERRMARIRSSGRDHQSRGWRRDLRRSSAD